MIFWNKLKLALQADIVNKKVKFVDEVYLIWNGGWFK